VNIAVKPSRRIALSLSHDHNHGPLGYLEMGNPAGAPVVFLHGFGADLLTWSLCLAPLARGYRLIALDLPGHGRTHADVGEGTLDFMTGWLDEALDLLGVRAAHLVGHSMGAKIALGFALSHGERVESLSLISPAGLGGDFHHDTLSAFLDAPAPEAAEALARHLLGPRGQSVGPALTRSLLEANGDPARAEALKKLLGQARAYGLALSPEGFDWSRIRCPVSIQWGDHDRLIPLPEPHRLPPQAPVRIIEGAGHLPHMEAPNAVAAVLKDFLP
jgi:pyruvate dehydrogenase E2 component (dihydrolipoamide acetyltransferase)